MLDSGESSYRRDSELRKEQQDVAKQWSGETEERETGC